MDLTRLDTMKYPKLRSLAKELGLKSNMKADKLLKAIKQHYERQQQNEREQVDPEEPETMVWSEGVERRMVSATEPEPTVAVSEQLAVVQPYPTVCHPGKEVNVGASRIPRKEGLLKTDRPLMKLNTPNFKKLHEAHFKKMESIDSYIVRKTKQKAQGLKVKTPRASALSPVVAAKPATQREASFRPSVLSTRRINVRFSEATLDNKQKTSLLKTPARMSSCVAQSTPATQTTDKPSVTRSSNFSATQTPAFVFTATPGTNKPSFDLKASLSKPLSYKPHKGKLKPFVGTKANTAVAAANTSVLQLHQQNYKQHQVQTREERRTRQTQDRKQKKESGLGARRGLVLS